MSEPLYLEMLASLQEEIGVAIPPPVDGRVVIRVNDQFDVVLSQRPNHPELALFSAVKTFNDAELTQGLTTLMAGGAAAQSGTITPAYVKNGQQAVLRSRLRTKNLSYETFRTWLITFFDALGEWQNRLAVPAVPEDCDDTLFLLAHAIAC
ncbi:type III secretion system chaperone [Acanthopleuribacter pedis]|uniref:Type III secretion system chaperone n=1 Tax=Acanthopleuribacter pedis TaxID=442870 RepID=A0A8J7QL49_9BACT|nr:type III secretion system chaperone [Acanthopleuribacter pedis]MBO1321905.1 type III secretion system chaperone [Acanthopleuribacter pedis]